MARPRPIINQCLENINANINRLDLDDDQYRSQLSNDLNEFIRRFNGKFILKAGMKKKVEKKYCDGYCYDRSTTKYNKNHLIVIPGHLNHNYCRECFCYWALECINQNPYKPVICQRCCILNKPSPAHFPDTFIFQYVMNYNDLYSRQMNYVDQDIYKNCLMCSCQVNKFNSMSFVCDHYLCENHQYEYMKSIIDIYYDYFKNSDVDVTNLFFDFLCPCKSQISRANPYTSNFYQIFKKASEYYPLHWEFLNTYYKFFTSNVGLVRCQKCFYVYELIGNYVICTKCKWCISGNHEIHSGVDCSQFEQLLSQNIYKIGDPMTPARLEDDKNVKIWGIILNKLETTLRSPKKPLEVWVLTNPYTDYLFSFARHREYGLLGPLNKTEADNALNNSIPIDDTTGYLRLYNKINPMEDKIFYHYCEIQYDIVENADPENYKVTDPLTIVLLKHNDVLYLNKDIGIRQLYRIRVEP
jgi:hypothetical protein